MFNPFNPSELFEKKFREKAHPEKEIKVKIQDVRELQWTHHADLAGRMIEIQKTIDKVNKKINVLLDLKILKEKIDKLVNL